MVTKRRTRSTRKVSSLKAKSLTPKQAKGVKGGIIVVCRDEGWHHRCLPRRKPQGNASPKSRWDSVVSEGVKGTKRRAGVILVHDLAPREDVKGGAGKRVLGDRIEREPRSSDEPKRWRKQDRSKGGEKEERP
jgi:hypothetical protein